MARHICAALLCLSVGGVNAASGVSGWKSEFKELKDEATCDRDAGEMARCSARQMKHSDRYLSQLIGDLRTLVPPEQVDLLMKSNELWFQFRDATCQFDAATAGGSSKAMRFAECARAYNLGRLRMLEMYRYCLKGGDCSNDMHLYYLVPSGRAER